jgi:uncharacterized RDD family membrane protein YckC
MGKTVKKYRYAKTTSTKSGSNLQLDHREPAFVYAEFGERLLAYLIDVVPVAIVLGFLYISSVGTVFEGIDPIWIAISSLVYFLYFFMATYLSNGQSIGQIVMKLEIIPQEAIEHPLNLDANKLSFRQIIIHNIGKVPYLLWLDAIIGFFIEKGYQKPTRLFQAWAKTVVISRRKKHTK